MTKPREAPKVRSNETEVQYMRRGLCAVVAFSLTNGPLLGQAPPVSPAAIAAGTHGRIVGSGTGSGRIHLTVLNVSHDSLYYRLTADPTPQTLGWDQVAKMDVVRGRHRHFGAGAALGLLIGAGAGALIGSSSASGNDGYTPTAVGSLGGLAGGLFGLVTGGVVGLLWRTDTWVPVAVPRLPHPPPAKADGR
ncbi:MAG: hypothetical protein ABR585_13450 [Gemmatimonadaceae bacterium]